MHAREHMQQPAAPLAEPRCTTADTRDLPAYSCCGMLKQARSRMQTTNVCNLQPSCWHFWLHISLRTCRVLGHLSAVHPVPRIWRRQPTGPQPAPVWTSCCRPPTPTPLWHACPQPSVSHPWHLQDATRAPHQYQLAVTLALSHQVAGCRAHWTTQRMLTLPRCPTKSCAF